MKYNKIANIEKATLEQLRNEILSLYEYLDTSTNDKEQYDKLVELKDERIKELELYNQKLFLRASATTKETIKEDNKNESYTSKLFGDTSILDDDELEFLKEIEEEL